MTGALAALQDSVADLRDLVEPLTAAQVRANAYPSEWSIADVLSHLGSGGVRMKACSMPASGARSSPTTSPRGGMSGTRRRPTPRWQTHSLWTACWLIAWPRPPSRTRRGRISLGPMQFDFDGVVGLRLNEHVLHTWDVEVAWIRTRRCKLGPCRSSSTISA